MLIIPKDTVFSSAVGGIPAFHSIGDLILPGLRIIQADQSRPVLLADRSSREEGAIFFSLFGKVAIPIQGNEIWVPIEGKVSARHLSDGTLQVTECSGETQLPLLTLAPDISLAGGRLVLSSCSYKVHLRLCGEVQFESSGTDVTVKGTLDAPVLYYTGNDGCGCAISTLLRDASIAIGPSLRGKEGTIRFELLSRPPIAEPFSRQFDCNDELLYQFDDPVFLGEMSIRGLPGNPITMSVELLAKEEYSRLLLSLFPAQVTSRYFGREMTVFVHGDHYDQPFTIDVSGAWSACCSNNVFFHLIAPEDPSGKALCKGNIMLEGKLSGNGLQAPSLHLKSGNPAVIPLFPESNTAQELPCQQIGFGMAENGSVVCDLALPDPLYLSDHSVVRGTDGSSALHAQLCEKGLLVKKATLTRNTGSEENRLCIARNCIIDGNGRVVTTCE